MINKLKFTTWNCAILKLIFFSGTIYTNKSLAFDPRQHTIQLIVSAVDKGRPPMTAVAAVHIQVVDVNNNAPKFSSLSYTYVLMKLLYSSYHNIYIVLMYKCNVYVSVQV